MGWKEDLEAALPGTEWRETPQVIDWMMSEWVGCQDLEPDGLTLYWTVSVNAHGEHDDLHVEVYRSTGESIVDMDVWDTEGLDIAKAAKALDAAAKAYLGAL